MFRISSIFFPNRCEAFSFLPDVMDFTHQEIADILGLTVENVKVRLHRARKKVEGDLGKKMHV